MITLTQCRRVLNNSFSFLRKYGAKHFVLEVHYRFVNYYHDKRLGIATRGLVKLADLGIDHEEFVEYTPIGYSAIYRALRSVPIHVSNASLLDFGSGKGRVVAVAATYPFKKVLGVEISGDLNEIAEANINNMRHRLAKHVELIHANAVDFAVPPDINVIFLFNPFIGKTLATVINNIFTSYIAQPRPIYIIFFNKIHFERLIKDVQYRWIRPMKHMHFYPSYSCGIYAIGKESSLAGRKRHWNQLIPIVIGSITNQRS